MSDTSASMQHTVPLKQRVFAASAWSLGGHGASMAIRFGSNLIMTRLLVPEMFGVMAIATVVMVGLAMFSDLGLNQNIVQSRRGNDPDFLNTAWTIQILRGIVLWLCALAVSLALALADHYSLVPTHSVYASPILPYVVAALSFGTVIGGFTSTKVVEARRSLTLGRITQRELAGQIVGLACMLAWASVDRSIWALVAGSLAGSAFNATFSHIWLPGTRNSPHWDRHAAAEIFHFGKWIFASSILGFLVSSGDRLLLGWMVDPSVLGVYAIAFLSFSAVDQVLRRIIGGVAFPALSEVVRHRRDLAVAYYRFHAVVASISYFSAGALMVSGQAIVDVLYDPRYADAGWMLQVLSVSLLTLPWQLPIQVFIALGLPRLHSNILVLRLVILAVAMPVGFYLFGLPGALWGFVASQVLTVPVLALYAREHGFLHLRKELIVAPMVLVGMGVGILLEWQLSQLV